MNKIFPILFLLCISVNAQLLQLKIVDFSDEAPLEDADIYFKESRKNFISNQDGRSTIDLENISSSDVLIVSKIDYESIELELADLKAKNIIIKLKKISTVDLKEAFVSNLKANDILQKVIDNYEKNYTSEQHYYKVNFTLEEIIDTINRDFADIDLQFRFKKNQVKVQSKGKVNERIIRDNSNINTNYTLNQYFNNISLKEIVQNTQQSLIEKHYGSDKVLVTKYADKYMYILEFKNSKDNSDVFYTIDKESFAIVEYKKSNENKLIEENDINTLFFEINYTYRPYQNKWILKESKINWNIIFPDKNMEKHHSDIKINLEVKDFSDKPFPEFNKSVNEKMDIRKTFKD